VLFEIEHLTDADLLVRVHELTHQDHQAAARFVAHLAEFDARQLYLAEGFPSLFTYCTQVLHFSEYTAYRRIEAARVARRFPVVLDRIADGSVHLTAITLLAPHLTPENHLALLESARHRTRRQIEWILSRLAPGRERPARGYVVPLPPAGSITSHVIERSPGALPARGNPRAVNAGLFDGAPGLNPAPPIAPDSVPGNDDRSAAVVVSEGDSSSMDEPRASQDPARTSAPESRPGALHQSGLTAVGLRGPIDDSTTSAERRLTTAHPRVPASGLSDTVDSDCYRLHVTISASTYQRLERARRLMSHANPRGDMAMILDRALGVLVEHLERRKFAQLRKHRGSRKSSPSTPRMAGDRSGRHLPASVRRAVWRRDEGQCTFVGRAGNRCEAQSMLEYHHLVAWSRGGESSVGNLTLRCRAHNAYDAEHSMGRRHHSTRTGASSGMTNKHKGGSITGIPARPDSENTERLLQGDPESRVKGARPKEESPRQAHVAPVQGGAAARRGSKRNSNQRSGRGRRRSP